MPSLSPTMSGLSLGRRALRRLSSGKSCTRLPALGLTAAVAIALCRLVPSLVFAAPLPRTSRRSVQGHFMQTSSLASPGRSWTGGHRSSTTNVGGGRSDAGNVEALWAGLLSPAALLLLTVMESRNTACSAFAGSSIQSEPQRISQVRLRESVFRMTPTPFKENESVGSKSVVSGLGMGLFLWYAANVSFNIINKQALGLFPHAWSVSVAQLAVVVACSAMGWATGLIESPLKTMGPGFMWRLLPAAICHALGNGLTSMAFSSGSVSFTHVVKTSEPIWMALGNLMINGEGLSRSQCLALVPIMLGVALASAGELSFTWVAFLAALGSTICFAGRGIFSKRLMSTKVEGGKTMSPLNVYALDSLMALGFTLPMAVLADGPTLGLGSVAGGQGAILGALLAGTGLAYYAYNAIAFKLLGKLDVVSHAVANLGKRVFVIGFSVLAFHTPLSMHAAVGSMTAILGSGVYSYVKLIEGKSQSKPTRSVTSQRAYIDAAKIA